MRPFCNVEATVESMGRNIMKWNRKNLTWAAQDGGFAGLSQNDVWSSIGKSWDAIRNVCGLNVQHNDHRDADIIYLFGHPQGAPGGVLADMQLPPGDDRQLMGRIDTQEPWARYDGPTPPRQGTLDLDRTMLHENGHAAGLPHLPRGNLLQPTWDPNIWTLQSGDIEQLVLRYGSATTRPEPEPPEPEPGEDVFAQFQFVYILRKDGTVETRWVKKDSDAPSVIIDPTNN